MSYTLSDDDRATLEAAAAQVKAIKATIAKLKRIGIDVTAEEEALGRAEQIRAGFLREFGRAAGSGTGRRA